MKKLQAAIIASGGTNTQKGNFGERQAGAWCIFQGLRHEWLPNSPQTLPPSLKQLGGKRPDFVLWINESGPAYYMDVKFHGTENLTAFHMEVDELKKYEIFRQWLLKEGIDDGPRQLFFMLYPSELRGSEFLLIELDEMLNAEEVTWMGKLVRKLKLSRDAGAWVKQDEILSSEEEDPV